MKLRANLHNAATKQAQPYYIIVTAQKEHHYRRLVTPLPHSKTVVTALRKPKSHAAGTGCVFSLMLPVVQFKAFSLLLYVLIVKQVDGVNT